MSEAMSVYELFNAVSGLNIPVGSEDEAEFIAEVTHTHTQTHTHTHTHSQSCWSRDFSRENHLNLQVNSLCAM